MYWRPTGISAEKCTGSLLEYRRRNVPAAYENMDGLRDAPADSEYPLMEYTSPGM